MPSRRWRCPSASSRWRGATPGTTAGRPIALAINDYNTYLPEAEWGGFKQSGIGRELGPSGLDEYREAKHIWQNTEPGPTGWFGG